jgi:3-oxoacyl-[acyl-carrier-protein] synthase I
VSVALGILSVGVCCSVGLDARQTASSFRAGVRRTPESDFLDRHGEPVCVGHLGERYLPPPSEALEARALPELEARLVRLAGRALAEALSGPFADSRLTLHLALPRLADGTQTEPAAFVEQLSLQSGRALELVASRCHHQGGAGLFAALIQARDELLVPGRAEFVVVGGVDSYLDVDRLARLEASGRLRTRGPQDAFTPGEGAGFVVLGSEASCRRHRLSPLAWITEVGLVPSAAERRTALARACTVALAGRGSNQALVGLVMAGLNGESAGAREWGVAALRNRAHLDPALELVHPAESIGDAGAALAPIMLASAALQLRSAQVRGPALVWAGSGDEPRGALLMYPGA